MIESSHNTTYKLLAESSVGVSSTSAVTSDEEARSVARKFEALLIQTMLKNMRSATPSGGLLDSEQADMYMEMFDQKISEEISRTGAFGIQDALYRQLTGQVASTASGAAISAVGANSQPAISRFRTLGLAGMVARDDSPAGFVNRLRSAASDTARTLGTSVETVIAIAALESGWGKKVANAADGSSTHNLFGIKADPRWQGQTSEVDTHEYRDGRMTSEVSEFRVYRSEQASIHDFGKFLLENPRYKSALEAASEPEQFIRELQRAGYATDPDYAEKVISTMKSVKDLIAE